MLAVCLCEVGGQGGSHGPRFAGENQGLRDRGAQSHPGRWKRRRVGRLFTPSPWGAASWGPRQICAVVVKARDIAGPRELVSNGGDGGGDER